MMRGMLDIKKIIGLIILSAFILILASCGKMNDTDGAVQSGELVVIEESSDIRLGIYGIDTLNPLETTSLSVAKVMNIVYEPLFVLAKDREAEPILAEECSLSADGKQVTISLKEGVKWQDGTNFTADDVVYTLSKMRSAKGLYTKTAASIHSFTAADKRHVIINFEKPEINPKNLLTFPIISKNSRYATDESFLPMGTGSYKFESKSSKEMRFSPSLLWHGGEIGGKNVYVKILKDENAAAEAFNVGEIDAVTSDELSLESATPKMNSRRDTIVSDKMVFLGFNTASAAVSSQNVRKAVSESLDKQEILETNAYGHGMVSELSINPSSWAYRGITAPERSEKNVVELLTGEGYTLSGGVYYKEGSPLFVRILVNSDNERRCALAESVAESLRSVGFSISVERVPYEEYVNRIILDDFDMFVGETDVGASLNPAAMLLESDNYFNFDTGSINGYVNKLYGIDDKEAYRMEVAEFLKAFYSNPPYIPLYFRTENIIYGSYVSGTVLPDEFHPYKNIEKWYTYDKDGKASGVESDE